MFVSEGLHNSQPKASSSKIILSGIAVILLMGSLSGSIVSTALPQIARALDGVDYLSWVVTAYLLSATCAAPICGRIGDIYGRRNVLIIAVCLFLLGSVLSAMAPTMHLLVLARFVQGLGGGAMMVLSQTVIADVVPARDRAKIQGLMGIVFTGSAIGGPFFGGVLLNVLSWHWVFLVNIPLAAIALFVVGQHVPSLPSPERVAIDYLGAAVLAAALSMLVIMTTLLGSSGLSVPVMLAFVSIIALLTVAFVWVERNAEAPILPLGLFSIRNFSAINANSFLVGAAMYGEIIFLPVYLQIVRGGTALETGFLMLPMMLGMMVASTASGYFMTRTGRYRELFLLGGSVMLIGFYGLTLLTPYSDMTAVMVLMAFVGVGLGPIMSLTVPAIQNSVPPGSLGVATASVSMFRQIGGSVGASVFGMFFAASLSGVMGETIRSGSQAVSAAGLERLDPLLADAYRLSVNGAIQAVFRVATIVSMLAVISSMLIAPSSDK